MSEIHAKKSPMPDAPVLEVSDLGRMRYEPALAQQREMNQAVIDHNGPQRILLVEHEPVITISHRKSAPGHLLADDAMLRRLGIEVCETDRGGDITYHGPGQLVVYPILRLGDWGLNLSSYMRLLEAVIIDVLAVWGLAGVRDPSATGVWVNPDGGEQPDAKICAMGVRIRKNVTLHGLALNVTTDLTHFDAIVPCGLAGRGVTSLQQILSDKHPPMDEVKTVVVDQLKHHLAAAREASAN